MRELTVFTTTILEVVNFLEYPRVINIINIINMVINMFVRVWNAVTNNIDSNTSRALFKEELKIFLLYYVLVLFYPK